MSDKFLRVLRNPLSETFHLGQLFYDDFSMFFQFTMTPSHILLCIQKHPLFQILDKSDCTQCTAQNTVTAQNRTMQFTLAAGADADSDGA